MSRDALVAVAQSSTVRSGALLVAFRLADHTNRSGWAWPSVPTLVEETGLSRSTVLRGLAELEEAGELHVERSRSRRGNRYRLRLDGVPGSTLDEAPDALGTVSQGHRSGGRNSVTRGAERSHETPGTVSQGHPNLENRRNLAAPPRVGVDRSCEECGGSTWILPDGENVVRRCPRCAP